MGSQTATYRLPYPTGGDRVMDGDDAIKALAQRVETVWQFYYTEVTILAGNTFISKGLVWPTAFTAAPTVVASVATKGATTAGYAAHIYAVTAAGCTLRVDKLIGSAPGSNVTIGVGIMVGETRTVL